MPTCGSFDGGAEGASAERTGAGTLQRLTPLRPGSRRLHRGDRFEYHDAHGRPIHDLETLERIKHLAIPPAWRDVWISPRRAGSAGPAAGALGFQPSGRALIVPPTQFSSDVYALLGAIVIIVIGRLISGRTVTTV